MLYLSFNKNQKLYAQCFAGSSLRYQTKLETVTSELTLDTKGCKRFSRKDLNYISQK